MLLDTPTAIYGYSRTGNLTRQTGAEAKPSTSFWGEDGFGFGDVLDIINPLQHIPVVSDIYQRITGDTTSPGGKVAGGALFGGIGGLLAGFVNSSIEQMTGQSVGTSVASFFGKGTEGTGTQVANANTPQARTDWSNTGERYDTASFVKRYQFAQALTQGSSQRINIAA